jgi:hypothetical protein
MLMPEYLLASVITSQDCCKEDLAKNIVSTPIDSTQNLNTSHIHHQLPQNTTNQHQNHTNHHHNDNNLADITDIQIASDQLQDDQSPNQANSTPSSNSACGGQLSCFNTSPILLPAIDTVIFYPFFSLIKTDNKFSPLSPETISLFRPPRLFSFSA